MNKELLQKAIEHIAQDDVKLGRGCLFSCGNPYCALGHMAVVVGIHSYQYQDQDPYDAVAEAYGLTPGETSRVYNTNDETDEDTRKQAILDLLKGWLGTEPA